MPWYLSGCWYCRHWSSTHLDLCDTASRLSHILGLIDGLRNSRFLRHLMPCGRWSCTVHGCIACDVVLAWSWVWEACCKERQDRSEFLLAGIFEVYRGCADATPAARLLLVSFNISSAIVNTDTRTGLLFRWSWRMCQETMASRTGQWSQCIVAREYTTRYRLPE